MIYTIWSRIEHEGKEITEHEAQELLKSAPMHTGPYGYMGSEVDLVLYSEAGEGEPVVEAIHYGGKWMEIPGSQSDFISHELATHAFEG